MKKVVVALTAGLILLLLFPVLLAQLISIGDPYFFRTNWDVVLPRGGELVYEADSGPSFHGDGEFCHVLRYRDGEKLADCLDWREPSADVAKKADGCLDRLDVPAGERTNFAACPHWTTGREDHSEIYIFLERDSRTLYVVEHRQ